MSVELNTTEKEATLVWCQGARAHQGFKKAIEDGDNAMAIYHATWAFQLLDRIAFTAPEALRPDGNETAKP